MKLKINQQNPQNVRYGNLRGSGLIHRPEPYCKLPKCLPKPNPTPVSPVPKRINRPAPEPLCAKKLGPATNQWRFNDTTYKDFNSFWVNIPRQSFTRLKTNGGNC